MTDKTLILHDCDSQAQYGDGPGVTSTGAVNSTGAVGANEQPADAHFSSPPRPDKRGAECYAQFIIDRQVLLRTWRRLPAVYRSAELQATIGALVQLHELDR
jgi:hypothetical protein